MPTGQEIPGIENPHPVTCSALLSWRSKKQSTVALSTAEAEYVALSSAAQECVWMRRLNSDLGNSRKEPTTIIST